MNRARWRNRIGAPLIGPPAIVLGTALLLALAMPAAEIGLTAMAADACPPPSSSAAQAANQRAAHANVHVAPQLTARGELTGQLLSVETDAGSVARVSLPAESFVGNPFGDALVYTSFTPADGSAVHLIDLSSGCETKITRSAEIVRSALLDPSGSAVYVHSVTREQRLDNGVERIDNSTGQGTLVVPPLPPSDTFGPIFGTQLAWSLDGSALAVQSCGFEACLTRVLDIGSGALATFDVPGQGALIGLTVEHLVTYAACAGLPCAVLSTDLPSGSSTVLADEAWSASFSPASYGQGVLTIETAAGNVEVHQ